ncbi:MAG: hypothetical protein U9R72_08150 [Chloroflexota bacterium]|nr:hypothetical protein [Chloroflexota bacterium]
MRFVAWYSIAVGILMLGQWTFFLASGQVPELQTEPFRIAFHLLAEGVTAIALIVSGISLVRRTSWARQAAFASLGMLTYTVLVSPGYFAELGQWPLVGMFGVLLILTLVSYGLLWRTKRSGS